MIDPRTLRVIAEDWPSSVVLRTITAADPAVATDPTITVPGESTWALLAFNAQLVTDANVANRSPQFRVTDGVNTVYRQNVGAAVTAGITTQLSYVADAPYRDTTIVGTSLTTGIASMILPPGFTFGVVTASIQAGDQYSALNALVMECFTGETESLRNREDQILNHLRALFALAQSGA